MDTTNSESDDPGQRSDDRESASKNKYSVMFIAGEASGDGLASELLIGLQELLKTKKIPAEIDAFGAGGSKLRAAGADISIDLTQHALVGLWEVLKHLGIVRKVFNDMLDLAFQKKPQVIILVDYPGFNLRYAKALRKRLKKDPQGDWNPKIVQFISPQIWAWHESRIHQIAKDIDLILSIFPFEKDWYAAHKPELRVEFVGHPLLDRFKDYEDDVAHFLRQEPEPPYHILLLPGSREKELTRHLPVLADTVTQILRYCDAEFRIVVPDDDTAGFIHQTLRMHLDDLGIGKVNVLAGESVAESLIWADAAIASSGTVTMECAYFRVPTVILYKTSILTEILGRMFIKVQYIGMPNLLAGSKTIYPEFIQRAATPENLSQAVIKFLEDKEFRRKTQNALVEILDSLGGKGACKRAAEKVFGLFQ